LYLGDWPGRGNGGIVDVYAVDGEWFNIPESVDIVGWMPVPDTGYLPIAELYAGFCRIPADRIYYFLSSYQYYQF
jgi:hypothetical protein